MQKHIVVIHTSVLTDTGNLSSTKVKRIEAVWSEQALRCVLVELLLEMSFGEERKPLLDLQALYLAGNT